MEMKVQRQKPATTHSVRSPQSRLCHVTGSLSSRPRCWPPSPLPSCGSPFPGQGSDTFQKLRIWKGKPGCGGGLCEYWERVWDPVRGLRGPADVSPSPPYGSPWSEHTENSLLQLCKLFSGNCHVPTAPSGSSKSLVSLAIFRGK